MKETTVAAPQMPFLRESVNAVPGALHASVSSAAKVGNATLPQTLDLRTLALTVIVGAVLMLAAYGAVWAGVRWWMGGSAAGAKSSAGEERVSAPAADGSHFHPESSK